jgi:hypothetical protein
MSLRHHGLAAGLDGDLLVEDLHHLLAIRSPAMTKGARYEVSPAEPSPLGEGRSPILLGGYAAKA